MPWPGKQGLLSLGVLTIALTACATEQTQPASAKPTTIAASTSAPLQPQTNGDFVSWRDGLLQQARQQGISDKTLAQAGPFIRLNEKVVALDQQQPEFTQTFWSYLNKRVSTLRIQAGKLQSLRHRALLDRIAAQSGVPAEILAAFWGLETNYGNYLGDFSTLEALSTLAFDPRRSDFFRRELLAALTIIDQGHVTAGQMKGSWAGAVGQMQFMPSVFLKHARDADGDGKADLWNSAADALSSAAAFLQASGWQKDQPWAQEVRLPAGFDYAQADGHLARLPRDWQQLGVTPVQGDWQASTSPVTLILPAGHQGPAFALYANFQVIKRWNRSNNYALSVSLLADQLAGRSELSVRPPVNERPWSRDWIQQLQQRLNALGYDAGTVDGLFGKQSAQALRQFQRQQGLPADGYPDETSLRQLQVSNP